MAVASGRTQLQPAFGALPVNSSEYAASNAPTLGLGTRAVTGTASGAAPRLSTSAFPVREIAPTFPPPNPAGSVNDTVATSCSSRSADTVTTNDEPRRVSTIVCHDW